MLQKEVAERVRALPGTRDYGPLSVLVQYYAAPTWGFAVPPGAFTPPPKVDSAVIRLDWRPGIDDFPAFTDFVHRAFSSRRKKLINNLCAMLSSRSREDIAGILHNAGIPAGARPETLSVEDFLRVYNQTL
jgi:16S rRNA (adenine1518-N6/adenine1519-N6)-dimethyltransferase